MIIQKAPPVESFGPDVPWVPNAGPKVSDWLLIFDLPSPLSYKKRAHTWGDEERLLDACLQSYGVNPAKVTRTYAIPYPVPRVKKKYFITQDDMERGHQHLVATINKVKPQKILCFGGTAMGALKGAQKPFNINSYRGLSELVEIEGYGRVYACYTIPLYFMFPAQTGQFRAFSKRPSTDKGGDPDKVRDFSRDVQKWARQSKPYPEPPFDVQVLHTVTSIRNVMEILKDEETITCDLETMPVEGHDPKEALNPHKGLVDLIGFGASDGKSHVTYIIPHELAYLPEVIDLVYDFISGVTSKATFVFHNAKFDIQFLTVYTGRTFINTRIKIRDTMLMNYLIDERKGKSNPSPHGLKTLSRARYDVHDYHFAFEPFWERPRAERDYAPMYHYLGQDLTYTRLLYDDLIPEIRDEGEKLFNVLDQLLMPGTLTLAEIELKGIFLNRPYFEELEWKFTEEMKALVRDMKAILAIRGMDEAEVEKYNPGSPQKVLKVLRTLFNAKVDGKEIATTQKETMLVLKHGTTDEDLKTFISMHLRYKEASKVLGTYVTGLMKLMDANDRVHGTFNLNGTAPGRLSSDNPNLQNIPTMMGPVIRTGFSAPAGRVLIEADYSQLELRVLAWISQDPAMIQVYLDDRDVHTEVAAAAFQKPREEIDYYLRRAAKLIGFGIVYGRTAQRLATSVDLIDYNWTVEIAQGFIDNFLGQFTGVKEWIEGQHAFVQEHQYLVMPTGRKRRFPLLTRGAIDHLLRQSQNTPIQSTASDFTLSALIHTHARLIVETNSNIVLTVHDSIMIECDDTEDEILKTAQIVHHEMVTKLPVENFNVPIKADVSMGPNWGSLDDYGKHLEVQHA